MGVMPAVAARSSSPTRSTMRLESCLVDGDLGLGQRESRQMRDAVDVAARVRLMGMIGKVAEKWAQNHTPCLVECPVGC